MNIQELRIGNRLNDKAANYEFKVVGIDTDNDIPHVHALYESGVVSMLFPEETEPLMLTEDWLLMAGFERDRTLSGISFHNFRFNDIELYAPDKEGWCAAYCSYDIFKLSIKYVHQLQNLYFALTGDELTFADQHYSCASSDPDDRCENCNCWKSTRSNCS